MKKRGFTLIELLAVIVILAIIALIATPLVLKYIAKSREGANDASVNSILRAAENYYLTSKLNNNVNYPVTLDLLNDNDIKTLGLKGSKPTDGAITIDKNGNIYLEAIYGDIIYVKLPNETKITKNPMVIGDSKIWTTDGNGTITGYTEEYTNTVPYKLEVLYVYIHTTSLYALRNEETEFEYKFDYTKDLYENIKLMEEEYDIDRSNLPTELSKEIDIIIEFYNTDRALSDTEVLELFYNNESKIPYSVDFIDAYLSGGDITKTKAYNLLDSIYSVVFTIPNYIKHEDGSLEKITMLAPNIISTETGSCSIRGYYKDLVISYGIENIGDNNFLGCLLESVTFASTVKTIGKNAFNYNKLSSLVLPKSLQTIEESAFLYNNIKGELIIPKNVTFIGYEAFRSDDYNGECVVSFLCEVKGQKNEFTNVIFEEGSKIETISKNAFLDNPITTLTIPRTVKTIGNYAFNSSTLTSVTIKGTADHTISMGYTPFGSATVKYEP